MFGPAEPGVYYDLDLPAAYTSVMCLLRPLDYQRAFMSKYVEDYVPEIMGVAQVGFAFLSIPCVQACRFATMTRCSSRSRASACARPLRSMLQSNRVLMLRYCWA